MEELIKIQEALKAPKSQTNGFGNYKYRSCEDILQALKPLLVKHGCTLTLSDDLKEITSYVRKSEDEEKVGLFYIEATATISKGNKTVSAKSLAGVNPNTKGQHIGQAFGTSSSYARKYALSGLLLLDDSKLKPAEDPDSVDNRGKLSKEDLIKERDKLASMIDGSEEKTEYWLGLSPEIKDQLTDLKNEESS